MLTGPVGVGGGVIVGVIVFSAETDELRLIEVDGDPVTVERSVTDRSRVRLGVRAEADMDKLWVSVVDIVLDASNVLETVRARDGEADDDNEKVSVLEDDFVSSCEGDTDGLDRVSVSLSVTTTLDDGVVEPVDEAEEGRDAECDVLRLLVRSGDAVFVELRVPLRVTLSLFDVDNDHTDVCDRLTEIDVELVRVKFRVSEAVVDVEKE
jgi:hypothetical protein